MRGKTTGVLFVALLAVAATGCDDPGGMDELDEPIAQPESPASPLAPDIPSRVPIEEPSLADYVAEARDQITPENVEEQAEALERELQAELSALGQR